MATEDSSATFKDILLELMVANETLDKIEVGIRALQPAQLVGMSPEKNQPGVYAGGGDDSMLQCCIDSYKALTLIAEETIQSGSTLIQIRNVLMGIRSDMAQNAELARLSNLERDREAKSATRTGLSGVKGGNRISQAGPAGGVTPGKVASAIGTGIAAFEFIPAAISSFLQTLRKELNNAFSGKILENLKSLGGKIAGVVESAFTRVYEGLKSSFSEIYAKTPESFRNFMKEFGEQFGKGLREMGADLRAMSKDLGLEKMFMSVTDLFKDVGKTMMEGAAETRAGLSDGFAIIRKNLKSLYDGLADVGKTMGEGVTEIKAGLSEGWGNLSAKMADLWKFLKESQLGKFVTEIVDSFRNIGKAFGEIFETFKSAGQGESFFAKAIRSITDLMDFVFNMGSKFGALGKAVGELLGKLALPITIILGIKDAITGWMNTEGDWTDKLQGALTELIDGLVGWAVDIPKMLISWVAGALGFKEFEKELDKMNFKDTILKPFIQWGQNLFKDFFSWMGIGSPSSKTAERNPVKEERKRDPKVLDNAANAIVNPQISPGKKEQLAEMLKVEYGFTKEEIDAAVQAKVSARIVNPQSDLATANKTGAEMAAYQKETSDLTAATAAPVVVAPGGGGSNVNTANVNNVTVNNSNLPDRTQAYMVPAFGF